MLIGYVASRELADLIGSSVDILEMCGDVSLFSPTEGWELTCTRQRSQALWRLEVEALPDRCEGAEC